MKKLISFSLCTIAVLSIYSCKNGDEKTPKSESLETEIAVKENFNIQIVAEAAKKDDFAVYFTENNSIDFKSENAVWSGLKGGNEEETLYFELTEDRIPTNIRLDFGINKEQDSVTVKSVKVNYYNNSFNFNGSDFFTYFNKDEQFKSKINGANKSITFYKEGSEYKTPYFYPTQLTNDKVKEITTKK